MSAVELLGCRIDALDMEQTVARCDRAIRNRERVQHVAVNAAKLVRMQTDDRLAAIIRDCALVNADGQSIVWASRLVGGRLPERVAGIDLMFRLLGLAEAEAYRVYVLGAADDVLGRALAVLKSTYPALEIVGSHHGYFSADDDARICDEIRQAKPDILLVAITSPRKEYWLAEHAPALGVPFSMGVGGAIDIVAGITSRAPRWMQVAGLEWAFRLAQEPRRLLARYASTNLRFVGLVAVEAVRYRGEALRRRTR